MNFIDAERENSNSEDLIEQLIKSGWMDSNVVIVNCAPEYSSRLTQLINHKTSFLNDNELYEQTSLELPKKGMNQVLCYDEAEFLLFDKYMFNWIQKHVTKNAKFLFVTNSVFSGKNLNKLRLAMKSKVENLDNIKFLTMYLQEDSSCPVDFFHTTFSKNFAPVFFWENKN